MRNVCVRMALALTLSGLLQTWPMGVPAVSAADVQAGVLICQVASGFGWIIGSTRTMECKYHPNEGADEEYLGSLSRAGLDLGYLGRCTMVWAVMAPGFESGRGTLAGNYLGASAQAAVILGGGVNVMTGGFHNSIALQPISVMGNTGLYVGGGIASMNLQLSQSEDN
jgi:hypothetical protein